jgi:hypothetical protein
VIRKAAGIEFPGWDPSVSSLVAEAEMSQEPQWGIRYDEGGTQALGRGDGKRVRVVVSERYAGQTGEPTLGDLSRLASPQRRRWPVRAGQPADPRHGRGRAASWAG